MARYGYTDGRKAVTLSDLDGFLDWLVSDGGEEDGEINAATAMRKVAFVYRCVRLIADAIRAAPFQIVPVGSDDPFDTSEGYENKLGFLSNPKRLNELVARSLLGPGYAYLFKANQAGNLAEIKYLKASTIKPVIDWQVGLTGFKRTIKGHERFYPPEKLIYFWPPDDTVEQGPPKTSPVIAGLLAAGANYYTSRFVADFFARGAIKGTLIAVKGNPPKSERERIKDWFQRTFGSGSKSTFGTDVINADALEPIKIGEGLEGLNNSELTLQMREDIAVALGVPMSKLLSSTIAGMGGGGVAESDDIGFYRDTVQPLGDFIADTLNLQLLEPLGYQWTWRWDTLDIYQQDEKERAVAAKTYVDSGLALGTTLYMLGVEVPAEGDLPPQYKELNEKAEADKEAERKLQEQRFTKPDEPQMSKEQQAEYSRERAQTTGATRAVDLNKWERMALKRFEEGHPEKALAFESDVLDAALKAAIAGELEQAETEDDVRRVFAWAGYP